MDYATFYKITPGFSIMKLLLGSINLDERPCHRTHMIYCNKHGRRNNDK